MSLDFEPKIRKFQTDRWQGGKWHCTGSVAALIEGGGVVCLSASGPHTSITFRHGVVGASCIVGGAQFVHC
jgi:hypothetical protein